jgi:hypothetical protein
VIQKNTNWSSSSVIIVPDKIAAKSSSSTIPLVASPSLSSSATLAQINKEGQTKEKEEVKQKRKRKSSLERKQDVALVSSKKGNLLK